MTEEQFQAKKGETIEAYGGIRKTMDKFLAHLEEEEEYERCSEVKAAMAAYDAGDLTAFNHIIE